MAAPTNTVLTTGVVGNREDLANWIDRIAPTETPFMSMIGKTKASNTLHEWQTQTLAPAADNAQAEGDDAVATAIIPTVRLNNRTQIASKTAAVSGSQEKADAAGRSSEMNYQMALRTAELKLDMEFGLTQNAVTASAPRKSRGLVGWVDSANVAGGVGYVAPNYVTNVAQTDGTTRALSEAQLKDVAQKVYTAGGNPNVIMMGPLAKQAFSAFTGGRVMNTDAEDKKVTASVDFYATDFGTLKAVPNRVQRARDVFVLQSDKWALAMYRPFFTQPLAVTGDSIRKQIIVEYCLEAKNPKANGAIVDIA